MRNIIKGAAMAALLAFALTARAQGPAGNAEEQFYVPGVSGSVRLRVVNQEKVSLCGFKSDTLTANITHLSVSCIDFDGLRRVAPEIQWPLVPQTQVLIHVKKGDAVKVTIDGESKWADLSRDAEGRLVALVVFNGIDHSYATVKIYTEER